MTVESTWEFYQRPNLEQLEHENDKNELQYTNFKNPQVYTGRIHLCVYMYVCMYMHNHKYIYT